MQLVPWWTIFSIVIMKWVVDKSYKEYIGWQKFKQANSICNLQGGAKATEFSNALLATTKNKQTDQTTTKGQI